MTYKEDSYSALCSPLCLVLTVRQLQPQKLSLKMSFLCDGTKCQGYLDEMKSMTESIKGFLKKADKASLRHHRDKFPDQY